MAEQILNTYRSRRNHAALIRTDGGRVVKKTFADEAAFQNELHIYKLLQDTPLPCARLMGTERNSLLLSELPGQTLVDWLERQEQADLPLWPMWEQLVDWLSAFHRYTGLVMTDVNLRNFLYDETTNTLYGLDFEECRPGSIVVPAASAAAYIRTYRPEHTPLKLELSQYVLTRFAQNNALEVDTLILESAQQEAVLLARRKTKQ